MNRISLAVVSTLGLGSLFSGCAFKPDHSPVLVILEEQGLFANYTETEIHTTKQQVLEHGWNAIYYENPHFYYTDSENLAEGGVGEYLNELKPYLRRLGVEFTVKNNWGDHDYTVTMNGEEHLIWSTEEFEKERNGERALIRNLSTLRTFSIINQMLSEVDAKEKFYAVNDMGGVFLTPALKDTICKSAGFRKIDWPYIPDPDDDWNGQPH